MVGVCRERSVGKLDAFRGRISVIPGATNNREVIKSAVSGCDGVLTVLAPWGVHQYAFGTAQAVLDYARPGARLVFSCGWHITRDGQDVYSWKDKALVTTIGGLARLVRLVELDDQGGLRPVHGRCRRERRARPRGPSDCRLPDALGPRARGRLITRKQSCPSPAIGSSASRLEINGGTHH